MTVLVLSQEHDSTVDRVVLKLAERGVPVVRCDMGAVPDSLTVDARLDGGRWCGRLRIPGRAVALEELRSVWYRSSPSAFTFPDAMSAAELRHAANEARFGFGGVLASLPVMWLNHPHREADAAYKPRQLVVADAAGLAVPRTLVTNDPAAVTEFVAECPSWVVVKVFASNSLTEEGRRKVGHTHVLKPEDLRDLRGVSVTAHQFQEWVPKTFEVRLTVVGRRLLAAAIHADSPAARVDWRSDYASLRYERIVVPSAVAEGVRRYMDALGLAFATIDFVVTPEEDWVFLEANPGGQYGWSEHEARLPISDAVTDLLAQGAEQ